MSGQERTRPLQGSERFTPDWGLMPDGHSRQPESAAAAREKLVSEAAAEAARNNMCKKCHRFYKTADVKLEDHRCDQLKCGNCKEYVSEGHQCYILEKDIKPHSEKYVL